MCLAVPVRVTETVADGLVQVRVGQSDTFMKVSTLLLAAPPQVGDYLIVHAGFALRVLDPQEAEESLAIFREMATLSDSSS